MLRFHSNRESLMWQFGADYSQKSSKKFHISLRDDFKLFVTDRWQFSLKSEFLMFSRCIRLHTTNPTLSEFSTIASIFLVNNCINLLIRIERRLVIRILNNKCTQLFEIPSYKIQSGLCGRISGFG